MTDFIIDFEQTATDEQIQDYFTKNSCTVKHIYNNFEKVYVVTSSTEPPRETIVTSVINDSTTNIAPLSETAVAIDSYNASSLTIGDDKNWWKVVTYVGVDFTQEELNFKKFGKKVTVYLLDSGVDLTHPEFAGEDVSQIYTFNGNPTDVNGHGTALASLITGKNTALTSTKVVSLKIFEQGTPTLLSKLIEALDLVLSDSANNQFSLLNMSWGIPYNEYVNNKLKQLYYIGNIGLIAAAGNNGSPITDITPACITEAMVVGAFDKNLEPCDFSNYTSELANTPSTTNYGALDVWAPGESIYVALPNNTYGFVAGTSFSAAIHTAAVAADCDIIFSLDSNTLIPKDIIASQALRESFSRGRPGLLDLTGQYNNSVNEITCMYPLDNTTRNFALPANIRLFAGKYTYEQFLQPQNIKSVKILNSLPPGFTLTEYGWITGMHEPLGEGVLYKAYKLDVEFTLNDDSITSKSYDLYVVAPTITEEDVPEELLWITQYGVNCSDSQFACGSQRCPFTNNVALRYCWDFNGKGGCEYCCTAANCCFTPHTLITMGDKSTKEIKDVRVGDTLLVREQDTGDLTYRQVRCVITRTERPMYTYKFSDGTILEASEDHPLFVVGKGWSSVVPPDIYKDLTKVEKIDIGDKVVTADNLELEIISIEHLDYQDTVYELDTIGFFANGIMAY